MFDHDDFSAKLSLLREEFEKKAQATYNEFTQRLDEDEVQKLRDEFKNKEVQLFHSFLKKAGIGTSSQEAVRLAKEYDI